MYHRLPDNVIMLAGLSPIDGEKIYISVLIAYRVSFSLVRQKVSVSG
jgi:hypothetical protein